MTKNNTGQIECKRYTYADLHQTINQVGLELCNNMKLEKKIKTEQYFSKKEMGDFCDQFDPFKETKKRKSKKDNSRYTQQKDKKPYQRNKKNFKKAQPPDKKPYKGESSKRKPTDKDKCYKCGKT